MVRYANDITVLAKSNPEEYMDLAGRILDLLELELNLDKSGITGIAEGFDFLGIHYQKRYNNVKKRDAVRMYPSRKSMQKSRGKARELSRISNTHVIILDVELLIQKLPQLLR